MIILQKIFLDAEHEDDASFIKLCKGLWDICSENFYFKIFFLLYFTNA